ncbi:hypothetical protein [Rhizobium indigoferae]|uniref:Uncharacterized protein n=1 Tax=Rhizobium indigoferae TaxID=158891 RepID=A0ABZ1DP64_9HYPH|nr:hypothetical protein [Rhizobium indigoferae]NNU57326.1 hypothetical protein [Rhizobium indigoferae]WRW37609.1 hypothetical protein U5G49_007204 [Rhizobium indigoferae]GLR58144.1 hypothetical protein GCM10007919_28690 [Rhizobium indigoferae]
MRQKTKPFIVEIKQSRKLKATYRKPSIWGKLDLKSDQHALAERAPKELSAVAVTTTDRDDPYAAALSSA